MEPLEEKLQLHAGRIKEGLETASEKNATQGWYNFVDRRDVEHLVEHALAAAVLLSQGYRPNDF